MLKELILKNRSYRRFYENVSIPKETLLELVDLARNSASGANKQPLKFILSYKNETNEKVFSTLTWAAYLTDWNGPENGEKPSAYIIILGDKNIATGFGVDHGIASQSILLGAVEKGFGGCILASIDRDNLRKQFNIDECYDILLVLALGKPKEEVVIDEVKNDDIKYSRDDKGKHHVPKRSLKEIVI